MSRKNAFNRQSILIWFFRNRLRPFHLQVQIKLSDKFNIHYLFNSGTKTSYILALRLVRVPLLLCIYP